MVTSPFLSLGFRMEILNATRRICIIRAVYEDRVGDSWTA